jgi:hypothetical protein
VSRLPQAVKRRIVEHLACYQSATEVVDLILEEFELPVTPRHVRAYDPNSFQYAAGPKWTEYYQAARRHFQHDIAEIPIANRAYRLRKIAEVHQLAVRGNDLEVALKSLEQAAKEVGDVYSSGSKLGVPFPTQRPRLDLLSLEERREMLIEKIREGLESRSLAQKRLPSDKRN